MKKLTLLKLLLAGAMAVVLYGQATPSAAETAATCPSFCFHLTCGGAHAHCVNGRCVCP